MPSPNANLERPCPSCGTALKVNAQRLHQKLQCPKCLSVFVLESIPAPPEAAPKRAPRKRKPATETPELESRYHELLARHAELADRYDSAVTSYEELLAHQDRLVDQIRHLAK